MITDLLWLFLCSRSLSFLGQCGAVGFGTAGGWMFIWTTGLVDCRLAATPTPTPHLQRGRRHRRRWAGHGGLQPRLNRSFAVGQTIQKFIHEWKISNRARHFEAHSLLAAGKPKFYCFSTFLFFGWLFAFHTQTTQTTIGQFWAHWANFSNFSKMSLVQQIKQFHLVTIGFTKSCFTCGKQLLNVVLLCFLQVSSDASYFCLIFENKIIYWLICNASQLNFEFLWTSSTLNAALNQLNVVIHTCCSVHAFSVTQ